MNELFGPRRRSTRCVSTVGRRSVHRNQHYKTTAHQTAEKQQDSSDTTPIALQLENSLMELELEHLKQQGLPMFLRMTALQKGVMRLLMEPNPKWRTSDGRRIPIMGLSDDHLDNIINWMHRKQADIDLVGDDRPLEKQLITQIWFYKLQGEQKRREDEREKPEIEDEFYPDDSMMDNLCDWPGDW